MINGWTKVQVEFARDSWRLVGEWKWSNLNKIISVCSWMSYISVVMYSGWCYDYLWRKPHHQFIIAIDLWTFEETQYNFLNLFLKFWYRIQTFIYKIKRIWKYFKKFRYHILRSTPFSYWSYSITFHKDSRNDSSIPRSFEIKAVWFQK